MTYSEGLYCSLSNDFYAETSRNESGAAAPLPSVICSLVAWVACSGHSSLPRPFRRAGTPGCPARGEGGRGRCLFPRVRTAAGRASGAGRGGRGAGGGWLLPWLRQAGEPNEAPAAAPAAPAILRVGNNVTHYAALCRGINKNPRGGSGRNGRISE